MKRSEVANLEAIPFNVLRTPFKFNAFVSGNVFERKSVFLIIIKIKSGNKCEKLENIKWKQETENALVITHYGTGTDFFSKLLQDNNISG